jgi:hypothetical protein
MRLRAADDFAAIRARLEELRRDRAQVWTGNDSDVAQSRPCIAGSKPSPSEKPGLPPNGPTGLVPLFSQGVCGVIGS